jgi:hypothetical protein
MPIAPPDLDLDLADLTLADWYGRLDELGDEHGYFDRLGRDHAGLFIDVGRTLLVTFETVETARRNGAPRGFAHVKRNGWSLLAMLSEGETWFRDPAVYGTMDRLTDDGFFEDFDRVLFMGVGSCGYAAAALSVAAPGAHVLALRPQATLDPAIAGWDRRFLQDRRRDFTSRYGYAPDMIDAAQHAWVLHDPTYAQDAMHAALFHRSNVTILRAPLTGVRIDQMLDTMEIMGPLIEAAMEGSLTRAGFARMWRARRTNTAYLRGLLKRSEVSGRESHVRRVCRHGLATRDHALFQRKLQEMGGTQAQTTAAQ